MANASAESTVVKSQSLAPSYEVPRIPLANIELPDIAKHVDKGIQSLGGNKYVEKVMNRHFLDHEVYIKGLLAPFTSTWRKKYCSHP